MEARIYRQLEQQILQVPHPRKARVQFNDAAILLVLLWAYLHDRAVCWACDVENWPKELDHPLPSPSCMSRRLRSLSVLQLLERVLQKLVDVFPQTMFKNIDSMPLRVGHYSHDRDAKRGRAAGEKARGYKLHAISSACVLRHWTLSSMASNDQVVAHELLVRLTDAGYVSGDNGYDANAVHASANRQDHQLVAPPRKSNRGVRDRRRNLVARLRSLDICDSPLQHCGQQRDFGWALMQGRKSIERSFSQLHFDGLYAPPPHVRHPRRMALWVACKLMIRLSKQAAKN